MADLLENFSITDIADGIRAGAFSAESVAEDVLARCARWSELGAIVFQDGDALLASARAADAALERGDATGPLHGVPILIKDNIDVKDMPCSAGTAALANDYPRQDATVVHRLRAAGALIAGKANLYELTVGGTGSNLHFGRTANPWRLECTTGGSSSGSAAAVAARLVPGSLGTDTAGSVRIPSSFCGVAGFRPSFHRYPGDGLMPHTTTRDSVGVMANSVADLAILDGVVAGEPCSVDELDLNNIRIGRPRSAFCAALDDRTAAVMDSVADLLTEQGAIIIDVDIPELHKLTPRCAWAISTYEVPRDLPAILAHRGSNISIESIVAGIASDIVKERFNPLSVSLDELEARYRIAMSEERPRLQKILQSYFDHNKLAAFMYPTTPFPTAAIDWDDADIEINGERIKHGFGHSIDNTVYQTATGIPSLTLPAGLTPDNLPVGLSFDGPIGSDHQLLAIGRAFERARGPFPRPPHSA
jgi:Asp-tRNA(Asn)/Glu-tRNA(Gln) amidotransferase A subunit family amidase